MNPEKIKQNNVENINNEKQREMIKLIEELNIGPNPKANVILVFLGLKPAMELDIYPQHDTSEKILNILENIGLKAKIKSKFERKGKDVVRISIAKSEESLEELGQIDPSKDHREYGRLMGYPETAIDAFLNKENRLSRDNYPKDEEIIFSMALSKENYQNELRTLREWSRAVKEYAPDLYIKLKGK